MRFSLALPTDRVDLPEEFQTGDALKEIAAAAEASGFDAVFVTDHPLPETGWLASGGHHTTDPFVTLAFAAAATKTLRLQTNLCVLGYRSPYITAKNVATLDVFSGGRVLLGVGGGYLASEFAALGADFEHRNELCDLTIAEMKRAWTGAPIAVGAHEYQALPRPHQRPHPPIWGGGNSKLAIRRAVELCDGWMPFPNPPSAVSTVRTPSLSSLDELKDRIAYAHDHAAKIGRPRLADIMFAPLTRRCFGMEGFSTDELLEQVGRQEELGVTQMPIVFERPGRPEVRSRAHYLDLIQRFAEVRKSAAPGS